MMKTVDLRSDTVTQPSPAMLKAMMNAPLGDDVLGDDPTVIRLEKAIAARLGKESALFVPSGTMANQIAIWLHTQRGDAIAVEENAHIRHYEAGGPAIFSSVTMRPVQGTNGIMSVDALQKSFLPEDPHVAPTQMVCVEDTSNRGGGTVYPLKTLDQIASFARQHQASTHLDGARLFNAQVQSGIDVARRAAPFDTVSICFSKGLGAPIGSALCMSRDQLTRAKRVRKAMGGGMRQSGVIAAAALFALNNNVQHLAKDHHHAQLLSEGLGKLGFDVQPPVSNMVFIQHPQADKVVQALNQKGVRCLTLSPTRIRLVTHLDIDTADIHQALAAFELVQSSL